MNLDRRDWPFAPRHFASSGGALHYVDEGSGAPVVLVHGTPTWSFEWRHAIGGLAGAHRILAPDHLGFGLSDRPADAEYTPEAHARRFAGWIDHVVPEGPLTLVVPDFGGPIALDWALDHPDRLAGLVVVNSWMWPFDDDPAMRRKAAMASGAIGRLLYRRFNASLRLLMPMAYGNRAALTPEIHRAYLERFPDADSRERVLFALAKALLGSSAFYRGLWDRRGRLDGVPLSLIWGMKDAAFGPVVLERWVTAFPGAAVTRFDTAGHWPHEERPDAFVSALARSLPARP